jgi:simple sugar transport system substrate-binding protein
MTAKLTLAAAALLAGALAAGPSLAQDAPLQVCFIYVGPEDDGGWSEMHDVARLAVEAEFGDRVETKFLPSVPEGPDAERAIENFARGGCGLIFTTSFGFMDPTAKVAAMYPDVKFEHATGFKTSENLSTYNARFYEGRYIAGQMAASISETGVAGYIGSFPIPEVIMGINAFMLGAQSVNPDFQVRIVWVNSWFDPGKEADAAKVLFDQGADIMLQHTDSPAAMQIAQERGLHAVGQSADMLEFGPDAQITSIMDHWAPYYIARTQAVLDGTWTSHSIWWGLKEGLVDMAPYTNVPEDVAAAAAATEARIASGEFHPFTGPIYKQDGTEVVPAGQVLDDASLLGQNYYVKGITDTLPQ